MNIDVENLANIFGYKFQIDKVEFKKDKLNNNFKYFIGEFHKNLFQIQKKIDLSSEVAKREFLVAPIIFELVKNMDIKVTLEKNTYFDETLKGNIDYVLNNKKQIFIAIEAKNSDIEKGVIQLMTELIAIDKIVQEKGNFIYGAVTIGFIWCFVILDQKEKLITQHIDYFSIKELEEIIQILVGILKD